MERKVKYLVSIIVLLIANLIMLIRFNYPLGVSTDSSFIHMTPWYCWILFLVIPALISITFLMTKSKAVCSFLAIIYFLTLFSSHLFFIIPPGGIDMASGGRIFTILQDSTNLSANQFSYFQFPIHYLYRIIIGKFLGLGISEITLSFYILLLTIPLYFSLFKNKNYWKLYFIFPVSYIILSYFFMNSQLVPQFTALVFLILTLGCYDKYNENENKIYYGLTISFYTICVFTHPFLFVFFPMSIFLDRYVLSRNIFPFEKEKNKISISALVIIYFVGYLFRFVSMGRHTRRLILPTEGGKGEAWLIFEHLFGYSSSIRNKLPVQPLYNLVSKRTYLGIRYFTLSILVFISLLLVYTLLKNIKKVESFDVSLGGACSGFFVLGLLKPAILGQRAFQVIFIKLSKYLSLTFNNDKIKVLLIVLFTILPILFTINTSIGISINGGQVVQDNSTIYTGRFIDDNLEKDSDVLVADLVFYPTGMSNNSSFKIHTSSDLATEEINQSEIDVIIYNPKLINRMKYYGLELQTNQTSTIYDMGDGHIYMVI